MFSKVKVIPAQKELKKYLSYSFFFFFCFILSSRTFHILPSSELIYFWHNKCQIWLCLVSELEAREHWVIEKRDLLELAESWTGVMRFSVGQCLHSMGTSSPPSSPACTASPTAGAPGMLLIVQPGPRLWDKLWASTRKSYRVLSPCFLPLAAVGGKGS